MLNNGFRTNDCVEDWHRWFKSVMQCVKPGVLKCITATKKGQKTQSMRIERINSNEPLKKSTNILTIDYNQ